MGCHTTIYRKLNIPHEEMKGIVLNGLRKKLLDDYLDFIHAVYIDAKTMEWQGRVLRRYCYNIDGYIYYHTRYWQRVIRWIEKDMIKDSLDYFLIDDVDYFEQMIVSKNCTYYASGGNGDYLLRVTDYPDDKLTSFQETIDFINHYCNEKPNQLYHYDMDKIEAFWKENPNSLLAF